MEIVSDRLERLLRGAIETYRAQHPRDTRPDAVVREALLKSLQDDGAAGHAAGVSDLLFIRGLPLSRCEAGKPVERPSAPLEPGERVYWMILQRADGTLVSGLGTAPRMELVIESVLQFEPSMVRVVWLMQVEDWPADQDLECTMAEYERRLQRRDSPTPIVPTRRLAC